MFKEFIRKVLLIMIVGWGFYIIFPHNISSQIRPDRAYGGPEEDVGYSILETPDRGYVMLGKTESFGSGESDVYLIKIDSLWDTLWTKTYGGPSFDVGYSIEQTSDGGYIITGLTASFGAGQSDIFLIKTDSLGNSLWTRTFGGTGIDVGRSVKQTLDNGFIIAGNTESFGAGFDDVYLIKTDSSGDTLWTKTYGFTGGEIGYSVQQTSDGGYIVAGLSNSYSIFKPDIFLIKTDSNGDTLWMKPPIMSFDISEEIYSILQTSDGGYIMVGKWWDRFMQNSEVYLVKADSNGDTVWTRSFGDSLLDIGYSIQQTFDGGYIICGTSSSFSDNGDTDIYLIKTTSSGDSLWTWTHGGLGIERGFSVQQTSDSGYVITGFTNSFGVGREDVYFVKHLRGGQVGIEESNDEYRTPNIEFRLMQNQPNPFNKLTAISYQIPNSYPASRISHHVSLNIYDITGSLVEILVNENKDPGVYQFPITSNQFPSSGIYFYRLLVGDFTATKKLILLR
jgi:hypothetical protein